MKFTNQLILFFVFTLFFNLTSQAQVTEGDELTTLRQMNQEEGGASPILGFDNRDRTVKGSPFLFEEWSKGSVTNKLGKTFSNVEIMLESTTDRLFVRTGTDEQPLHLDKLQVAQFKLTHPETGDILTFEAVDEGEGVFTYMEVLHSGEVDLYKKVGKSFVKGSQSSDSYGGSSIADKYVTNEQLFLVQDGQFLEIRRSIRSLYKALPGYKAALKKEYKSKKLDLDSDRDLASLVMYYEKIK